MCRIASEASPFPPQFGHLPVPPTRQLSRSMYIYEIWQNPLSRVTYIYLIYTVEQLRVAQEWQLGSAVI